MDNSNKLIDYRVEVDNNKVIFEVKDMNENLRFKKGSIKFKGHMLKLKDKSGYDIFIGSNILGPRLDIGFEGEDNMNFAIYLRGSDKSKDNDIIEYECKNSDIAQLFKEVIESAITIYSKHFEYLTQEPLSIDDILNNINSSASDLDDIDF